jgi:hypothetical protein
LRNITGSLLDWPALGNGKSGLMGLTILQTLLTGNFPDYRGQQFPAGTVSYIE